MSEDEYVYDEESGEWMAASELKERRATADRIEVRDAVGNLLADGDQVTVGTACATWGWAFRSWVG